MSRRHTYPLLLALCLLALTAAPAAGQGGSHRAALVVRFPDGGIQKRCVAFSEASISGEKLLQDSGLTVIMNYNAGLGGAVCSIQGQGCAYPREDCFCRCQGVQCEYWAYYHWTGGGWQYSQVGASSYQVSDGALEGWSWGPGNFSVGTLPPAVTYEEICIPPTATPTATPTRTATPPPTATATATALPTAEHTFLPQISFEATANSLTPGACAVLKWVTWDADRVTLNGAAVGAQDRQEVCPATPQRYVLVASNAAGQVTREIAIAVVNDERRTTNDERPQPTNDNRPTTATPSPGLVATGTSVATLTPQPIRGGLGLAQAVQAQAAPTAPLGPVSDRATPAAQAGLRPSHATAVFQPAPSATPTAPRRRLADPGQPTPTPILLAFTQASANDGPASVPSASSTGQSAAPSAPDRRFRLSLLPGYGAYLLTAGLLLAVGAIVTRRREIGIRD